MRYAVIGMGAIGGYYGGKLAHSGQEVHFLSHSDYKYVREKGLSVDSCDGSFVEQMIETTRRWNGTPEIISWMVPAALPWALRGALTKL